MKRALLFLLVFVAAVGTALGATTYRYNDNVQTVRGDAVGAAQVSVYHSGTSTLASLYSGISTATSALTNPTYTDSYGRFYFYAEPGVYDIVVSGNNITTYTIEDVRVFSPTAGIYDVTDYGAIPDDGLDDSPGIQAAIDAAEADFGATVRAPDGTYLIYTELLVSASFASKSGVYLVGDGPQSTVFRAMDDDMNIVHWAGSWGGMEGIGLSGLGIPYPTTGVTGLRITPEDETQTTTRVHQDYNKFSRLLIEDCEEGIVLGCGPYVDGSVSGCYFNTFSSIDINRCTRGIWFKDPPDTLGSGSNRNQFFGVRMGLEMNTGLQIDAGGTNSFFGCSWEEIATGTSPNATPIGIKIEYTSPVGGRGNSYNMFYSAVMEANTMDIDIRNSATDFYGGSISGAKIEADSLRAVVPFVFFGAGATTSPVGYKYQQYNTAENDSLGGGVPQVFVGSADPSVAGFYASRGSLYMRTNGSVYIKTGTGTTDWGLVTTTP